MSQSKKLSFIGACREFFGFHPGQTLTQFGAEIKALSHNDKMEIAAGLRNIGINCSDPGEATAATTGNVAVAA